MKTIILTLIILLVYIQSNAQGSLEPTDKILAEAYKTAKLEKKNVFIIFHASWCGWCRKMDASMNDSTCKAFFDNNYVIRHLVVLESKERENLNNPGANELLNKYEGQGLPFWLIFDEQGTLLADSKMKAEGSGINSKGENVGCPASAKEVDFFIKVLKKTSKLTDKELSIIAERFKKNKS